MLTVLNDMREQDRRMAQKLLKQSSVTAEQVRELFDYSPVTGLLRYRKDGAGRGGHNQVAGAVAGTTADDGYVVVHIKSKVFLAHRVIWLWMTGEWPQEQVDHENRLRNSNAWHNLREASNRQNHANRTDNKSGHVGVMWEKARGKWKAYARIDYTMHNIGRYDTVAEAVEARKLYLEKHDITNP